MSTYVITRLYMDDNRHSGLRPNTIYCELREKGTGLLEISATLEHVLAAIRDRELAVDGVTVARLDSKRGPHTVVRLDHYSEGDAS